jgi:hypothetical protein
MLVTGGEAKLLVIELADMEIEHLGYAEREDQLPNLPDKRKLRRGI